MPQQQSPWLETAYGWAYGENGWNAGMDSNLLKFSVMFDRNVDSIVSSLPAVVNGQAHYLTTDNRLYFAAGGIYYSAPVPKWFVLVVRSTGQAWQFNGTSLVQVSTPAEVESRLDAVELTVSSLGTAAFEDISTFATQANLDVAEANAASYTDQKIQDLNIVNVKDLGAIGDGLADDYPILQSIINDNAGKRIIFPAGTYRLGSGTLVIPSGTYVEGDPGAIVVQPNKGEYSAFATAPGTINVKFEGLDIRGPWYGTGPGMWVGVLTSVTVDGDTLTQLKENIGINCRGRWYQRQILGYNAAQMNALTDATSRVTISNCRIDGFGQEAIFVDRVTGFKATNNTLLNCGRGGIRMYGVLRGTVDSNVIGNMSPGWDGQYPNWNVYGITATRMQGTASIPDPNLTISRPSQDVDIINNHVYNCYTWKSLDQHGAVGIRFIGNKALNSYIGLGIDQGGTNSDDGIAPPIHTVIANNIFESNSSAQYMRAGMTIYGHDAITQQADGVTITGNILIGYGGNDTDGGISLSNCKNAAIVGNVIKGAPRSGINMSLVCEDVSISSNTIEDPKSYITVTSNAVGSGYTQAATSCTVSGGGGTGLKVIPRVVGGQVTTYSVVHPGFGYTSAPTITVVGDGTGATATATFNPSYGILSQSATVRASVDLNNFSNKTQANMRAISRSAPSSNSYGVKVGANNSFTGTIIKLYPAFSTDESGNFLNATWATARVTSAGVITNDFGIASINKTGTGVYELTISNPASSISALIPIVSTYAELGTARASVTSASAITVTTTDITGALADKGFVLALYNVNP